MIAHIFTERCTNCAACVTACPTHVLDPGEETPVIARLDQCQTCYMCELYCEADAIYVATDQFAPETIDPQVVQSSGQLGRLRHDYGWNRPAENEGPLHQFWQLGPLLREGAKIAAERHKARNAKTTG